MANPLRESRVTGIRLWGPLSPLALAVAALCFGFDQTHKYWMLVVYRIGEHQPVSILPFFDLVLVWNHGISYGLFRGHQQWLLIAISLTISIVLWIWATASNRRLTVFSLGLVIGGALGNALDRLVYGAVADFFHFHFGGFSWYVFNMADIAIVAGVAGLLYESISDRGRPSHGNA
jgi:signal peptidase II